MMDFLRALAPNVGHHSTRASVVLPPRFAERRPLTHTLDVAAATEAIEPASRVEPNSRVRLESYVESERSDQPVEHRSSRPATADIAPVTTATPRELPRPLAGPLSARPAEAKSELSEPGPAARLVRGPRPDAVLQPITAVAPSAKAQFAPLSPTAVAARSTHERHARPVVHVTIDRIEVRASSPPQAPPPARRRATAPRVSLSEYLRAGARRHGGEP